MTDDSTEARKPDQTAQPLALRLNDQLGLVERLRNAADVWGDGGRVYAAAANEIEWLRAELSATIADRDSWADQASQRTQDALDLVAAERERCGQVYGSREVAMSDEIRHLAREAHTWSKAAETYAAQLEHHKPLAQAVRNVLEEGQLYAEDLALLRQALEQVERALGPNAELTGPPCGSGSTHCWAALETKHEV